MTMDLLNKVCDNEIMEDVMNNISEITIDVPEEIYEDLDTILEDINQDKELKAELL